MHPPNLVYNAFAHREYRMPSLKSQDLYVLLKLAVLRGAPWTYASVADALHMSSSEVHAAVKRSLQAGLYNSTQRRPVRSALQEFIVHGSRYAFAPGRTGVVRGVPTSHAAPVMASRIIAPADDIAPVWADAEGSTRGEGIEPLHSAAPIAAREDQELYALLALVDAIRIGRARERRVAEELLKVRLAA